MSSTTVNQVWQTIQHLGWNEQLQLVQLLLQALQKQWGYTPNVESSSQLKNIRGKYAFVATSSEAFAQQKQQEIELEER